MKEYDKKACRYQCFVKVWLPESHLCEASELREIQYFFQPLNTPETVSLIYFDWDLLPIRDEGFSKYLTPD